MFRIPLFTLLLLISTLSLQGEISTEKEILSSSQNPLAALYGIPETNIHGVNVINGSYNYAVTDFYIPGSEPLFLQRHYSTSTMQKLSFFNGWTHNLCSSITTEEYGGEGRMKKKFRTAISQGSLSGELPYFIQQSKNRKHICRLNEDVLEQGVTNCGQGEISGRTNVKNSTLNLQFKQQQTISQTNGDGSRHKHRFGNKGLCGQGNCMKK